MIWWSQVKQEGSDGSEALTIAGLVVHKHSQTTALDPPSRLRYCERFAAEGFEQGAVSTTQIAQAADGMVPQNGDEVEAADGVEVPFEVGEDDEV